MQTTGGFMKCNFKLKSHNRSKEFRRRYFKFLPLVANFENLQFLPIFFIYLLNALH